MNDLNVLSELLAPYGAAEPTKQRAGDQNLPHGGTDCVQDRIIAEMNESKRVGIERYGSVLKTFNGRRSIQDAREEARDLFVYLTQIQMEMEADRETLIGVVEGVMREYDETSVDSVMTSTSVNNVSEAIVDRILAHYAEKGNV